MTGVENTIPDAVIIIFLDGFRLSGSICHSVNLLSLLLFMHSLLMSHRKRRHNRGSFSFGLGGGFLGRFGFLLELLLVVHVVFQCLY